MMRRAAAIVVGPILAFLVSAFPASAQPARTNARVWYVYLHEVGPSAPHLDHFRARMAELGWREGRNLTIDYRGAGGDGEKLAAIMREVSASKVDVILAVCTPEAKAALAATQTIPIVFAAAGDAVKAGLVDSYARPGHNVTGFTSSLLELSEKRIELLKEVFPSVRQVAVVWRSARTSTAAGPASRQASRRAGST